MKKRWITWLLIIACCFGQNSSVLAETLDENPQQQNVQEVDGEKSDGVDATNEIEDGETVDQRADSQEETPAYISDDSENRIAENISYNVAINGICLIDKGQYCEVGVDYVSDDPNVEFAWKQYDVAAGQWSDVTSWNKGNWTSWKPLKSGDYWIYVEAKNHRWENGFFCVWISFLTGFGFR